MLLVYRLRIVTWKLSSWSTCLIAFRPGDCTPGHWLNFTATLETMLLVYQLKFTATLETMLLVYQLNFYATWRLYPGSTS